MAPGEQTIETRSGNAERLSFLTIKFGNNWKAGGLEDWTARQTGVLYRRSPPAFHPSRLITDFENQNSLSLNVSPGLFCESPGS